MVSPGDVGGFELVRVCVWSACVRDLGGVRARRSSTTRGACCYKYKHPHVVISSDHIGIFFGDCARGLCVPVCVRKSGSPAFVSPTSGI